MGLVENNENETNENRGWLKRRLAAKFRLTLLMMSFALFSAISGLGAMLAGNLGQFDVLSDFMMLLLSFFGKSIQDP